MGNPAHPDDPQNFIYLNNIEGVLNKQETTTCNVDFAPAEALRNDIGCIEEQQMAISSGAAYIPTCREDEPSEYSPCQCESVDTRTSAVCYCVDTLGNIVDNQMKEMISESTTDEVCAVLQCEQISETTTVPTDDTVLFSSTVVGSVQSALVNADAFIESDGVQNKLSWNAFGFNAYAFLSFILCTALNVGCCTFYFRRQGKVYKGIVHMSDDDDDEVDGSLI